MRYLTGSLIIVLLAGLFAMLPRPRSTAAQDVKPIPTETIKEELRQTMIHKLTHSQNILHGLVTRDFDKCATAAGKLKQISLHSPKKFEGDESDNEVYQHFKLEFVRLINQVETLAHKKNIEGTAFAYQNLTANCLACHSYLADRKATVLTP